MKIITSVPDMSDLKKREGASTLLMQMMEGVEGLEVEVEVEVPEVFICPISLEPMDEPVTLVTGQTYERRNILRWFAMGHYTCPTTMQELWDTSLTPNTTLRRLICKWYAQRFFLQKIQAEDILIRVRALLDRLRKAKGRTRVQTLAALRALVETDAGARKAVVEEGGAQVLCSLLGPFTSHSVAAEAIGILVRIQLDGDMKSSLSHPAKISLMVDLLHEGLIETKINSARLIESILTEELRYETVSSLRLLFGVLRLVKDSLHPPAVAAGLSLLRLVCSCKQARALVVGIGVVAQLVELLPLGTAPCLEMGIAILETLSTTVEGRNALKDCAFTIPNVVGVLMRVSEECTQRALVILLAVCRLAPEECAHLAVEAGLAGKLLLVIQSAGDPLLKQKSSELLKLCSNNYTAPIFVSKCEIAHTIQ